MNFNRFSVRILRNTGVALLLCSGVVLSTSALAAVACKSDHVTARAFGDDGGKAWAALANDQVNLNPFGTVSALDDLGQGRVDIALSARGAATPAEEALRYTPIAWDAVVLIVHPSSPVTALSMVQLRDIYAGRVRNWVDVGGADKPINLYAVAGPLDGVEYELRRVLFGNGALNVAAGRWYLNTTQLEDAIAIDPAAMGVTTLSAVHANPKLRMLRIEGVDPSMAALENGTYLLATPLYAVNRADQLETAPASRFAAYLAGPEMVPRLRAKQLVPASEAAAIVAALPERDLRIATLVGRKPPVPPPPPIARTAVNPLPVKAAESTRVAVAAKRPATAGTRRNAVQVAQQTRVQGKQQFR